MFGKVLCRIHIQAINIGWTTITNTWWDKNLALKCERCISLHTQLLFIRVFANMLSEYIKNWKIHFVFYGTMYILITLNRMMLIKSCSILFFKVRIRYVYNVFTEPAVDVNEPWNKRIEVLQTRTLKDYLCIFICIQSLYPLNT